VCYGLCLPSARPLCWVTPRTLGPHYNFWISMCKSPPMSDTRYIGSKIFHCPPVINILGRTQIQILHLHLQCSVSTYCLVTFSNFSYKEKEVRNFEYTKNKRTNKITNWLTALDRFLSEKLTFSQLVKKFLEVLESEVSLQHSQAPANCTKSEAVTTISFRNILLLH